ncbi:hypothetical protein B0I37DRAFT_376888 [Chaetomium sp. MPI-CAGE-AT-0009]|nr:hypothetical protein B0I37DRAFT_376888 [Chaetomium sp. MPI-CAGE-AT-0009]
MYPRHIGSRSDNHLATKIQARASIRNFSSYKEYTQLLFYWVCSIERAVSLLLRRPARFFIFFSLAQVFAAWPLGWGNILELGRPGCLVPSSGCSYVVVPAWLFCPSGGEVICVLGLGSTAASVLGPIGVSGMVLKIILLPKGEVRHRQ